MGVPRQSPQVLKRPAQLCPDCPHSWPDLSGFISVHAHTPKSSVAWPCGQCLSRPPGLHMGPASLPPPRRGQKHLENSTLLPLLP